MYNFKFVIVTLCSFISLNGSNISSMEQKTEYLNISEYNNITYNYSPIKYTLIGLNTVIFIVSYLYCHVNHAAAMQFFWMQITYCALLSLFFSDVIKNKFIKLTVCIVGMIVLPIVIAVIVAYCRKKNSLFLETLKLLIIQNNHRISTLKVEELIPFHYVFPIILFIVNGIGIGLYEGLRGENKVNSKFNKKIYEYNKKIKLGMLITTLGVIISYFTYNYFVLGKSHAHEVSATFQSILYFISLSLFMSDPYKITLTKLFVYSSLKLIFPMLFTKLLFEIFPCPHHYRYGQKKESDFDGRQNTYLFREINSANSDPNYTIDSGNYYTLSKENKLECKKIGTKIGDCGWTFYTDCLRAVPPGVSNVRFYVEWYGLPILLWIINTVFLILCYKHNKKITTSLYFISPKSPLQNHLLHA